VFLRSQRCRSRQVERSGTSQVIKWVLWIFRTCAKSAILAAKRRRMAAHGRKPVGAELKIEPAPKGRQKNTRSPRTKSVIVERSHCAGLAYTRFTTEKSAQVETKATSAAPAFLPPCSPWDTPPGTSASPRPRSQCAGRLRRAEPGAQSAAPATTSG
jgi:hypothetical protein